MSRRMSRSHRTAVIPITVMVALVVIVAVADRYLGNRAPWRWPSVRRQESEALTEGHRYLEGGQNRHAIRAVARIDKGSPAEAEALTIRGLAEANLEEVVPARRHLERAWKLRPNAAAARVLAAIYLSAFETERGLQMLLNASRLDTKDFRPWYAMGELVYLRCAVTNWRSTRSRRPSIGCQATWNPASGWPRRWSDRIVPRRPSRSCKAC